jgi:peptidoglycan hydrolase-like protein with peptidoglycan-binding domain
MNNTGGGVAMLQWAVKKCNAKYNLGEVDGIYGGRTRDGVRAAQSHLGGLTLDGLYGPATHNKMRFYNAKGGCTADSAV